MGILTLVYVKGLFNLVYGVDAKIYASISREMLETGSWLEVYHKGEDYLDKPPLHFWLSTLSFKLFGVGSFAYKLPSFLFTILGTYATFKLGGVLYSKKVGRIASLIFYSSLAIVFMNQDVRTDTILTAIVVFSVWQLIAYVRSNKKWFFIGAFVGIGFAMLAKGPLGIMIPVLTLGTEFLIKKDWKNIFRIEWLLGIVISLIVISPMLYGLYTQFDLQRPDKVFHLASGKYVTDYSGLKFYFWDQSFGRVLGGNSEGWKNDASALFFTHTYLWSFLPWSILGIFALVNKLKTNFKNRQASEWYLLGAIILPFIAFSMSSYKLPHYISPLFPFLSILTAAYLVNLSAKGWVKASRIIQFVIAGLMVVAGGIVILYFFPLTNVFVWVLLLMVLGLLVYALIKQKGLAQLVSVSTLGIGFALVVYNYQFVPEISKYEGGRNVSIEINKQPVNNIYTTELTGYSMDLYTPYLIHDVPDNFNVKALAGQNNCIFTNKEYLAYIKTQVEVKEVRLITHKELTRLSLPFINPETRASQLETYYLVFI